MDSSFYNARAYQYDEASGVISRNEDYDGLNALFRLPIVQAKADKVAAAAYVESLLKQQKIGDDVEEIVRTDTEKSIEEWVKQLNESNIREQAIRLEDTVQVLQVDKDGYINVEPYTVEKRGGSDGMRTLAEWAFQDNKSLRT